MVMPLLLKDSTSSPLWKPPVIATVALARVGLSRSDTMRPLSTTTGVDAVLSPAVKDALPPDALATGVWSVAATVTVRVTVLLLLPLPSLAIKLSVRVAVFGVTALSL